MANLRNIYEIRSNPETWYGRADILMIPRKSHNYFAYIIEFKTTDTKTDTEKTAQDAIEQIQEKEYISAILNAGIKPDKIIKLAIILQGKKVVVEIEKFNTPGTV